MTKKPQVKARKRKRTGHVYLGLSVLIFGTFLLSIFFIATYHFAQKSGVLGATTMIADQGRDNLGSQNSSNTPEYMQMHPTNILPPQNIPNNPPSDTNRPTPQTLHVFTSGESHGDVQLINCTGPDGKTAQMSISNCQKNAKISGVPMLKPSGILPTWIPPKKPEGEFTNTNRPIISIKTKDDSAVDINADGMKLQIGTVNGKLDMKAVKPDGSEVELNEDQINTVNNALISQDEPQIAQQNGNTFVIKKGNITAQTQLPVSFNLSTRQISVTTPTGVKNITVLPDQVISNLQKAGTISGIQGTDDSVTLTDKENDPVFVVNGVSSQELFGFIPVNVKKTINVSATTGQIISQDETLSQKVLDIFSF